MKKRSSRPLRMRNIRVEVGAMLLIGIVLTGCGSVSTLPEGSEVTRANTSSSGISITDIVGPLNGFANVHMNDDGIVAYWSSSGYVYDTNTKALTDLSTLVPCVDNETPRLLPQAVNASGIVLFNCFEPDGDVRAYVWDAVAQDGLTVLPGEYRVIGSDLNDSGTVVGTALFGCSLGCRERGFVWNPGDLELTEIGPVYGLFPTSADRINASGYVVGATPTSGQDNESLGIYRYYIRSPTGEMTVIPNMEVASTSGTVFINDAGEVAGGHFIRTEPQQLRTFFRSPSGLVTDLGLGSVTGLSASGSVLLAQGAQQVPVVWHSSAQEYEALGTLGGAGAFAQDINDAGQVVGSSTDAEFDSDWHAFIWDPAKSVMTKLGVPENDPDARTGEALRLNNSGQVVGHFVSQNSRYMAIWNVNPSAGIEPIADAGGPYTVIAGNSVTLDGSGSSDPEGSALSYSWDFDHDGVTFNASASGASPVFFTTAADGGTVATVALRVANVLNESNTAMSTVTILSQSEAIEGLIADVQSLAEAGTLKRGQANGLIRPLGNAIRSLEDDRLAAACSQIGDFVAEVDAKESDGALPAGDAASLRDGASTLQSAIGCD